MNQLGTLLHRAAKIQTQNSLLEEIKESVALSNRAIDALFWQQYPIDALLKRRARFMDELLYTIWCWFELEPYADLGLFAVGGYGAGQLQPYSDIDTLILIDNVENTPIKKQLQQMISFLWDCGIEIRPSVRTLSECRSLAKEQHTIFTSLLTHRRIAGGNKTQVYLESLIHPICAKNSTSDNDIWPLEDFFAAKLAEKQKRYHQYSDTEYNQEPNIKQSPGGLRDIDFIHWMAKRLYGAQTYTGLVEQGLLSEYETQIILQHKDFFNHMRYALHLTAGKPTDRLFLEYQTEIAKTLHIAGNNLNDAVSHWMQSYFTRASQVREITDILTQSFHEMIANSQTKIHAKTVLSPYCSQIGSKLIIENANAYEKQPNLFLSLFLIYTEYDEIDGFSAQTLRFIYDYFNSQPLTEFANCKQSQDIFLRLFEYPQKTAQTLTLMHQLGLLSKLIPSFAPLIGQMQYDLNHIYTVDAHTLRVLQNVQSCYRGDTDFPYTEISLEHANAPTVLYLAALFHDSGKGQGGDHSQIGASLSHEFALNIGLNPAQRELIGWLVTHHLKLSHIAQREDINDPSVITKLIDEVGTQEKLAYLYLLTICDIKGTNPKLWNQWRKSLISELFIRAMTFFDNHPSAEILSITGKKTAALTILVKEMAPKEQEITRIWHTLPEEYFDIIDVDSLVFQTKLLLKHQQSNPIVSITPHYNQVGTDIFIYSKNCQGLFANLCQTLEKLQLNIVDAKVSTTQTGYCLYALVVFESSGQPITGPQRRQAIKHALNELLTPIHQHAPKALSLPHYSRHVPRWYRYYQTQAFVKIYTKAQAHYTTIEIHAPDFPGLLARIGKILVNHGIRIHSAKINTLADKVIDFFYVTQKSDHMPLTDQKTIDTVKSAIVDALH